MSLEFARVVLVFMLAPLSSYLFWVGLGLTQVSHDQPIWEPWIVAITMTSATVILYIPLAVVVLGLWVYWTRKAVDTFPRLIVSGVVCGGLVGLAFAIHKGPLVLLWGLSVGAIVGVTLALGTRCAQRRPARGA